MADVKTLRIILAAGAALALAACHGKPAAEAPNAEAKAVSVVEIGYRPLGGGVTATGALVPRQEAAVAADVAGYRVTHLYADVGDYVKAGAPLAALDASVLSAQVAQQEAAAAQADVQARLAEAEAARVRGLDKEGVLSVEQVEQRQSQAKAARAAANAQAAGAREARTRLAHLTIRAPVSGLIIERTVRPGDLSGGAASPWFRMAQGGQIELAAQVDQESLGDIHPGQSVQVSLPGDQTAQGVVRLVSPAIDPQTRLAVVRITLPVRSDIRAGGFGRANFSSAGKPVLAAPEASIRYDADGASVMVVGSDNKVSQVKVSTGARGGGYVQLTQGPPAGSRILAKAASLVLPGDVVKPTMAAAKP